MGPVFERLRVLGAWKALGLNGPAYFDDQTPVSLILGIDMPCCVAEAVLAEPPPGGNEAASRMLKRILAVCSRKQLLAGKKRSSIYEADRD